MTMQPQAQADTMRNTASVARVLESKRMSLQDSLPPPKKKGLGCFLKGCLTSLACLVLVIVIGWIAFSRWWSGLVQEYTSDKGVALETVVVTDAKKQELNDRLAGFRAALDQGRSSVLVLTVEDINVLICTDETLSRLKDSVRVVEITPTHITAVGSVLLSSSDPEMDKMFRFFKVKGRYLNPRARMRVIFNAGFLAILADHVEVNGKPLPEDVMKDLRSRNLMEDALTNPDVVGKLSKMKSITLCDGAVSIEL